MLIDTDALRKKMIDCGHYSVSSLARSSKVSVRTILSVLDNKTRPSSTTIEKLTMALKIEPEEAGKIFFNRKLRNTQA